MSKPKAEGRKAKEVKDPNKPKRSMSAFFIWMQANRERIKKEKPGLSVSEIAKAAGVEWNSLPDKSEWEKKAVDAKKRYERELAAYTAGQKK